jgi:phenylacetaldehyde dehydrogenase
MVAPTNVAEAPKNPCQRRAVHTWVEAKSGKTFEVEDPATQEIIAHVPAGDKADIDAAVAAARKAFEAGPWPRMLPGDRARLVWRLGDLLEQHADEFAELESLDNGKPVTNARRDDVQGSINMFRYMAGWSTRLTGETIPVSSPGNWHVYTLREPVGVVGQIIPWNFPLMMAAWKLAPALAAGCTIVLKPAEQTPLSALRFGELIQEAGFPGGVVNIVTGYGETAGAALANHPDVDKVAFTGSTKSASSSSRRLRATSSACRSSLAASRLRSSSLTPISRARLPEPRRRSSITRASAARPAPGSSPTNRSMTASLKA